MLSISVNGQSLFIPADTAISWQQPNAAFSPDQLSADIVWTFSLPAQPNALILDHAGFVYCSSYRRYPATVSFQGLVLATGFLYIQQADADSLSCGMTLGGFDQAFASRRLADNSLPPDITIASSINGHNDGWRQFLADSLSPDSFYKFFLFYSADFYSPDDNPSFGHFASLPSPLEDASAADLAISFVNRLFLDDQGNIIETPATHPSDLSPNLQGLRLFNDSTSRSGYTFAPAIRLDWLLHQIFSRASFSLSGTFLADTRIHNLFLQSLHAMDAPTAIYADSRFVAINDAVEPSNDYPNVEPTPFLHNGTPYRSFIPAADSLTVSFSLSLPLDQLLTNQTEDFGLFNRFDDVVGFLIQPNNYNFIPTHRFRFVVAAANPAAGYAYQWRYGTLPTSAELIQRARDTNLTFPWSDPVVQRIIALHDDGFATVRIGDQGYVGRDYRIQFISNPGICTFIPLTRSSMDYASFEGIDSSLSQANILSGSATAPDLSAINASGPCFLLLSRFRIHNHTSADPAVSASSITLRDGLSYPCASAGLYLQQLTDWDSISLSDPFQVPEPVNIFSNTFHLADFLPDITNAELLSALAQFFGLSLYFDNIARRIQLDFFTDTLRAEALDLSQYVTSRQRLDYSPSPRSVSFNALRQNLDTKNINPLPPVASRSQLPDATTHPAAICFVRNENTFLRSERESDDSPVYHWHPAFGNNLSLDILPPDTDPLSQPDTLQPPHIAVPNMRVADGQRIPKYLLEVNTKGSSPLLESNYDNLFSPILVQYRGRRRLQLQRSQSDGHSFVPSAFIEDANPTNFNPDGSVNPDYLSLTTSGQGSVGELYLRPYHDFMARQEKFRFQALVPAHLFLLIRQLLLPQDGPVASQLRWILVDGSRFLPSSITYEFSSADLVTVSIDCSRPHTTP